MREDSVNCEIFKILNKRRLQLKEFSCISLKHTDTRKIYIYHTFLRDHLYSAQFDNGLDVLVSSTREECPVCKTI
jgi:hypothetical protein